MKFHLLHPRAQLVTIMSRIYHGGMTTLSGGNLSVQDENGDIWITPAGVDKGSLTPQDIMCVHADGTIEGPHRPSSEYPFHRAIYERRPDLRAIVHAHPPALVSFSIVRKVPESHITPQAHRVCGSVGYAPYALPGSEYLGENIATTFAQGYNTVLLENHGIATGGPDLLTAFQRLETLDFSARTQLKAYGLGEINVLTDEQLTLPDSTDHLLPEFAPKKPGIQERTLRQLIVEIVQRACDRQLMTSTVGVLSARVDEHRFLITPTGMDRRSLEIEDIVLIGDGQREAGKQPARSVRLHQAIYERHPEIGCIIAAQPPNATAYAISNRRLDTKTIPESYIMLRNIPVIPYGIQYTEPEQIARMVCEAVPVILIQNDGIMTTGKNVLQAFDRLEVAEYTAHSLINTGTIGSLVPMSDQEIRDLDVAFALPPCPM